MKPAPTSPPTARRNWLSGPLLMLVMGAGLIGCGDDKQSLPSSNAPPKYKTIDPVGSAVRPKRRYYVHNDAGICSVYWTSPDKRSIRRRVRCPRALQPAERLRLSGRNCFRESDALERRGPVRCPPAVLRPERDDRVDAGEYVLREADEQPK